LEALTRKHDLRTPGGRLALVQAAAQIVGELRSTVAREHHRGLFEQRLRKLAEQWHPGDAARAIEAERALRLELQRAWSRKDRRSPVRADEFDQNSSEPTAEIRRAPTGDEKAEALLLRAALAEAGWATKIGAALAAEEFLEPRHRQVAAVLLNGDREWRERLRAIRDDPEMTEAASALLMAEGVPPIDGAQVDGSLSRLVIRSKRRRKKEYDAEILQGRIGKNDPRYQEYLQLVDDLSGQGPKGEG
jgi:DNA primase